MIYWNTRELDIVIDYQLSNIPIKINSHPLLCIDELLDYFNNEKYFSKIDLASGYPHIKIVDEY